MEIGCLSFVHGCVDRLEGALTDDILTPSGEMRVHVCDHMKGHMEKEWQKRRWYASNTYVAPGCTHKKTEVVLWRKREKKRGWERSSNSEYFPTSAHLVYYCVKWAWLSNCGFQKVTKMVRHSSPKSAVRKRVWSTLSGWKTLQTQKVKRLCWWGALDTGETENHDPESPVLGLTSAMFTPRPFKTETFGNAADTALV